jgi:predicted PurR-regulated permease PerM
LVLWGIGAAVAVAVGCWLVVNTIQVLLLVYLSGLLATGLYPVVTGFERAMTKRLPGRLRLPRWAAILILYLSVIAGVAVTLAFVLPPLVTQAQQLVARGPTLVAKGQRALVDYGILQHQMSMRDVVSQAPEPGDALGALVLATWSVVGGLAGFVTVLILTYYFLVEADDLLSGFVRLFPRHRRLRMRSIAATLATTLSAWLSGQIMLAGLIGATVAIGLGVAGVPYFYVLALLCAVGEMIPYVGPLVAAVPAVGVAASVSPQLGVGVAVFLLVVEQIENNLLAPAMMQRQVGLSVVAVIVSVLLGSHLLGIAGVILAVPTAAILQVLFQQLRPSADDRPTT